MSSPAPSSPPGRRFMHGAGKNGQLEENTSSMPSPTRERYSCVGSLQLFRVLARIDHRFGNEGDFGRPERFSESFAIDPVQVE